MYQFVEVMTDILSTKEAIKCASLGIPKGMKNTVSIYIVPCVEILIRIETAISEEYSTKFHLK